MVEELNDPRRVDPPYVADERAMYDAWLDYHRVTLLLKCEGLDGAALRARPIAGSLMSLHGLVRHMADVERNWFRRCLDHEDVPPIYYDNDTNPEGDFEMPDDASFADDLPTWQAEVERARAIAAAHGLDDVGRRHDRDISLRWVYVHMIEEYAWHNGHADLIRELVGGSIFE